MLSKNIQSHQEEERTWKRHIESYKASGLSRAAYCRKNGITYYQFKYWYRKLAGASVELVPIKLQAAEMTTASNLPVLCSLELSNQCRLYFHDMKSVDYVLEKLKS